MFQLINRIPAGEFEFLFICGMGPESISGFKCIHVSSWSVPGNKNYRFATPMFRKGKLDRQIEAFAPDIMHISTPSLLGNYALKTAKRLGVPVVSIYHTHFISYVDYYTKNFPFLIDITKDKVKNTLRSFYNRCDTVYVPSATMIHELISFGIRPEAMKLWQRGIDKHLFSPQKRDPELIQSITGNSDPCILFVSRLVWEKNLQLILDLYGLAEKKKVKYNFILVGDGVAREAITKQMPKAFFLGHVGHEKLAHLYASADVFLFPSVTETFGNVVLEAMASGLPCVIANSGGSKDFIDDGVNGYTCNPYDTQGFLDRISEIIEQPALAGRFSEKGLEISKKYEWERLVAEYFEDLKTLSHPMAVV
ncbi:MAG: glycosyltransferase family 1 protein [Tannerellaceae bacterium]|nr:glycosyltransferase family 1 protein [Tannerellaceae bacterium]